MSERASNRFAPILDSLVTTWRHSLLDVVENFSRIFSSRVIAGRNHDIGAALSPRAHLRSLPCIAITARSENKNQSAGHEWSDRSERALERIRCVRVVAQNSRSLGDNFQSSGNLRQ